MPSHAPRLHRARHRRLIVLVTCLLLPASLAPIAARDAKAEPPALDARQTEVMGVVCARCHVRPGIGAPLLGDSSAWAELGKQGLETLTAHTVSGFGGMPPLGTCSFCSEDDLRTMVAWMAGLSLPTTAPAATRAEKDERP